MASTNITVTSRIEAELGFNEGTIKKLACAGGPGFDPEKKQRSPHRIPWAQADESTKY